MEGKYYTLKYYTESGCIYYEWLRSVCELTVVSVRRTVLINYQADDLYCIYYVEGEQNEQQPTPFLKNLKMAKREVLFK